VHAPQQPRKPTRVTQLPAAIMKNGQLSTEMTSVESSDDVTDDAVGDAEAAEWTVGDATTAESDEVATEREDARTSCV